MVHSSYDAKRCQCLCLVWGWVSRFCLVPSGGCPLMLMSRFFWGKRCRVEQEHGQTWGEEVELD